MCNCKNCVLEVKVKKNSDTATLPTCGTEESAGWDLYADIEETVVINPGEMIPISTGISFTAPEGYFGAIFARSGMAFKKGLRPCNCVGIIDRDYTGDVKVGLYNDSELVQEVNPGDRIAQVIFLPYPQISWTLVDSLEETDRGEGGFGSTGSN